MSYYLHQRMTSYLKSKKDNTSEPITELTFDDIYNALNYQNFIPENRGNYGESLINNSHRYLTFMANITNKPPFISGGLKQKNQKNQTIMIYTMTLQTKKSLYFWTHVI